MAPAMIRFHVGRSVPLRGMSFSSPITTVRISSVLVIMSGHRYWFHPKMNSTTKRAAMLAHDSGSRKRNRKRSGPAPSSWAASASSLGIVR